MRNSHKNRSKGRSLGMFLEKINESGDESETAHSARATADWNDSKTPSISTNWRDASTRAGGSKRRLDCPRNKLLDEIHVRVVRHSDSPSRGVSPEHDCYRYGFPRP